MEHDQTLNFAQLMLLVGLSMWLSLALFNNIVDRETNVTLLHKMLSMETLKDDPHLGNGLEKRAINNKKAASLLLTTVIVLEFIVIILMWRGVGIFAYNIFTNPTSTHESRVAAATIGLIAFCALWLFFLCGGLYFGYWIKTPHLQQVHLNLLLISITALILIRM